ncbi:hypothetical protein LTR41_002361 [Exophiala xenobiotica]|nr:hypothetical protein LTR41_002361 [Exophiala xenobiotica]
MASDEQVAEAHKTLYDQGIPIRTDVTGPQHVQRSLQNNSSDFARPMQELATEWGWGSIWTRPGLEQLAVHVRGAINNGASELEIRETLMQVGAYCGLPAGLEGVRVAEGVLKTIREEDKPRE